MKDFTLDTYRLYLETIQAGYSRILRFDEYLRLDQQPDSFAMIRHDVDRRPMRALRMAQLENELGVRSTYYFRTKLQVFKPTIIRAIRRLGHEIGYHYETLSDANGDHALGVKQFRQNLSRLRRYSPVNTISMHGRPLSPHNNLDLWHSPEDHEKLATDFDLLGEVYLDIDYSDIAYISDTGRNWDSKRYNQRDFVDTHVDVSLKNGKDLLQALKGRRWQKLVFQIHPERWSNTGSEYFFQYVNDTFVNLVKKLL